jgi:predicted MFS family arabinose efflux permease
MPALVSANFKDKSATLVFGLGNVMLGLGSMTGNFLGGVTKDLTSSFQLIHCISLGATMLLLLLTWLSAQYLRA